MMATTRGALSEDRYKAAQRATHLNPTIQLLSGNKAATQLPDGSWLNVANSTPGVQLFWGLEGCKNGLQHYRYCTPHALNKPLALCCPICSFDPDVWVAEGRQQPWESEQLLMRKLVRAGVSEVWCFQVSVPFWAAPVDFMHTSKKAIMQADGSAHFKDTFSASCQATLDNDMRCVVRAVSAGVSVIRVHDLQLQRGLQCGFLSHASFYATNTLCVLLSVGYTSVFIYEAGRMQTYVQALVGRLPGAKVLMAPWGIVVLIQK
jgi:very-short-patch-repair endonuclease